jgi:hypothetical protein
MWPRILERTVPPRSRRFVRPKVVATAVELVEVIDALIAIAIGLVGVVGTSARGAVSAFPSAYRILEPAVAVLNAEVARLVRAAQRIQTTV